MIYIILGCLAFIILTMFDQNKYKQIHNYLNLCFPTGILILAFSTVAILLNGFASFALPLFFRMVFYALAVLSLILQLYTLFFALPFSKTYVNLGKGNQVIDTGMFALCRHPGVIWFFFFYLFLWVASGKMTVLWAGIIWTILDILHVYIQDRWYFPKILNEYNLYITRVPFLIPNKNSLKNAFQMKKY
ncbi:MAG: hypothetical protein WC147_03140 [Syntrophomonas sp.]